MLKSNAKPNTNKRYIFFTPQTTERSKFEIGNNKKSIIIPHTNIISKKIIIDEHKA